MDRAQSPASRGAGANQKGWADEQSPLLYRVSRVFFWVLFRLWVRCVKSEGGSSVPASGGIFLIANHTSALDPFIVSFPIPQRMTRGPGKIELYKNPIVGWYMHKVGIFPLRRDMVDTAGVRTMVRLYRRGAMVIVYPEAGRAAPGQFKPFDPDFARLVIKLRAPLLPAGIAGADEVLPIGSIVPRRNTPLAIVFGKEFTLSDYYDRELTPAVLEAAAAFMQSRVAEQVERARALRSC